MGAKVTNRSLGLKRAPSAYALFCADMAAAKAAARLPQGRRLREKTFVISKASLSTKWKSLGLEGKRKYVESASSRARSNATARAAARAAPATEAGLGHSSSAGGDSPSEQTCVLGQRFSWQGAWLHTTQQLGQGSYGTVYLAEDHGAGLRYAVKVPLGEQQEGAPGTAELMREHEMLRTLAHPGIISCWGVVASHSQEYAGLILQLADSNLSSWLREQGVIEASYCAPKDQQAKMARHQLCMQLTQAVAYLHIKAVLHGDLKPGNIHSVPVSVPGCSTRHAS
jgi:hypothetical protein